MEVFKSTYVKTWVYSQSKVAMESETSWDPGTYE